ncbi:MAG: hypothetical protein K5911_02460 [Eubacteriales bacterium]|nr:hypothetical protein [Eubacteriales bacterium]
MSAREDYIDLAESFLRQKQDWAVTGAEPYSATRELRYGMEQQEKRLKRKGLVLEEEYAFREGDIRSCMDAKDNSASPCHGHTAYRETRRTREFRSGDKVLRRDDRPLIVYANVIDRIGGGDFAVNCPNCGSVTMASQLEQGCPYCGTFFRMKELYPRVSSYYTVDQVMDRYKADERLKKTFTRLGISLVAVFFLLFFWQGKDYKLWFRILFAAFYGGFTGAIGTLVCYLAYSTFLLFRLFRMAGKSLAMLPGLGTKKKLSSRMEAYEPAFSTEAFEGRIISKLKTILFSDDRDSLNLYEGNDDLGVFDDLVDMEYRGAFKLRDFRVMEGHVYIILEFFMEDTYYRDGRLRQKDERLLVSLERKADAVTDPGFTVSAVQCRNCGSSFDALHKKECPYCGTEYRLDENDWLITGIRKN